MGDERFDELEKLSKPLIDFLKNNYHPHTSIIIDFDGIRVVEDSLYLPIKLKIEKIPRGSASQIIEEDETIINCCWDDDEIILVDKINELVDEVNKLKEQK